MDSPDDLGPACDKTGELAGELWLGYFRDVERLPEATAKARAQRLGWKE